MKNLTAFAIELKEMKAINGGAKPDGVGKPTTTGKPAWAGTGAGRLGKGKGTPGVPDTDDTETTPIV